MKSSCATSPVHIKGFSLIEVLIGAVILATGLLALSALQGALARNAADSRIRSQVAAALESAAEADRGRSSFASVVGSTRTVNVPGVGALTISSAGAGDCVYVNLTDSSLNANCTAGQGAIAADGQYKRLQYRTSWVDATGGTRTMNLVSIVSPRTIANEAQRRLFETPTEGVRSRAPIVRTVNPEVPGMIPIAIGDGSDTAATNPKPTIVSGNVIRTSYEVLTYQGSSDSNIVKQQRRVETAVIGCTCSQGAGPTGAQFERAQWPAYWEGNRYVIYQPSGGGSAPGVTALSKAADVTQDILCTECCRDHKDATGTSDVKFDPYRSDQHEHYKLVGNDLVAATDEDDYLEVCRMVRVDGFWRTAQDLDAKHFGLLETQTNARSYIPSITASGNYETFVIDYLTAVYVTGTADADPETLFAARGLNAPATISINKPNPVDTRYLHSRGLYVDNIEPLAREKIDKVLAPGGCNRASTVECVLPLLSFTSINTTEASFWSPAVATNFTVDSDGFVVFDQDPPNRGRVNAIASAAVGSDSDVNAKMTKSNAGIAARARGIDPEDDVVATDAQTFNVLGSGVSVGDAFTVALTGLGSFNRSPGVGWTIAGIGENNCQGPSPYRCEVVGGNLPQPVTVTVSAYNRQEDVRGGSTDVTCRKPDGTTATFTYSPNGQNTIRWCRNYQVTSADAGSVAGTIGLPARDGAVGNPSTGANSEATQVSFSSIPAGGQVSLGFTLQGSTAAPVDSCSFKNNGNLDGVVFQACP